MEYIFNILGFASLAYLIVDFLDTIDTTDKLPQKPFKCTLCMGFWLSVIPLMYMYGFRGILFAALVGVTSETLDRQMNK